MCILLTSLRIGMAGWCTSALVVSTGSCAVRKRSCSWSVCSRSGSSKRGCTFKYAVKNRPSYAVAIICSESSFLCCCSTVALAAVVALWKWRASRACSRLGRAGLLVHIRYRRCHHSRSTLAGKSLTTHFVAGASSGDVRRREEVWRSGSPSAPT